MWYETRMFCMMLYVEFLPSSPDIRPLKVGPPRPLEKLPAKLPLTGSYYPEDYKPSNADVYRAGW